MSRPRGSHRSEPNEQHFETEHLRANLKRRTVSSGLVAALAQLAQLTLNVGATMVLARLLMPRDFGLVAMVMTAMGFLRIFRDAGLSAATVQREGISHAQVSNLFWTNVALSAFASTVMVASAPLITWFYGEPALTNVTLALAVTFVLSGLAAQHLALLNRQMRFKAIASIQVTSTATGVLVGVWMAWSHCGYWSLVGLQLTMAFVSCTLTWRASRWRPQWLSRHSGMRSLLTFGANVTASGFMYSLARGVDGLLIGKYYGSDALGLYSRAAALLSRPVEQFTSPLNDVFVPALSRLQGDPERYRRTFLQAHDAIALAGFVFTGLFAPLASPLILVVLGPQWRDGAVIFAALTVAALFLPLCSAASWLFASQGRGRDWVLTSSAVSMVTVGSFVVGLPFSPQAIAVSYAASGVLIVLPIMYQMAGREGPVRTSDLWISFVRHIPLGLIVFGTTLLVRGWVVELRPLTQLATCVSIGLLAGGVVVGAFAPVRRTALSLARVIRDILKRDMASRMPDTTDPR